MASTRSSDACWVAVCAAVRSGDKHALETSYAAARAEGGYFPRGAYDEHDPLGECVRANNPHAARWLLRREYPAKSCHWEFALGMGRVAIALAVHDALGPLAPRGEMWVQVVTRSAPRWEELGALWQHPSVVAAGGLRAARDADGNTPLMVALRVGHPLPSIASLVAAGAEWDVVNARGETPWHVACQAVGASGGTLYAHALDTLRAMLALDPHAAAHVLARDGVHGLLPFDYVAMRGGVGAEELASNNMPTSFTLDGPAQAGARTAVLRRALRVYERLERQVFHHRDDPFMHVSAANVAAALQRGVDLDAVHDEGRSLWHLLLLWLARRQAGRYHTWCRGYGIAGMDEAAASNAVQEAADVAVLQCALSAATTGGAEVPDAHGALPADYWFLSWEDDHAKGGVGAVHALVCERLPSHLRPLRGGGSSSSDCVQQQQQQQGRSRLLLSLLYASPPLPCYTWRAAERRGNVMAELVRRGVDPRTTDAAGVTLLVRLALELPPLLAKDPYLCFSLQQDGGLQTCADVLLLVAGGCAPALTVRAALEHPSVDPRTLTLAQRTASGTASSSTTTTTAAAVLRVALPPYVRQFGDARPSERAWAGHLGTPSVPAILHPPPQLPPWSSVPQGHALALAAAVPLQAVEVEAA